MMLPTVGFLLLACCGAQQSKGVCHSHNAARTCVEIPMVRFQELPEGDQLFEVVGERFAAQIDAANPF